VRSVEPSLTTVISTAPTGEVPTMCSRAARQRRIVSSMLASSLSAGMAMRRRGRGSWATAWSRPATLGAACATPGAARESVSMIGSAGSVRRA
jgi:hypothetical protein